MSKRWTSEQSAAIETRGKTLLVSAAAGSGKTTVLTERIIRLLTDPHQPASLDRMLIVTFTRAAAGELRQRISRALSEALARDPENRHLHNQLLALNSAKISTIHAYCLELIRNHFQRLGLPAQFRVADEAEAGVLSRALMDEIIGEQYAADPEFGRLADHFTGARNDSNLADVFLSLYEKLSAYPEGVSYLADSAEALRRNGLSFSAGWGKVLLDRTKRLYTAAEKSFSSAVDEMAGDEGMAKAYLPAFAEDLTHIRTVCTLLADAGVDYTALRHAVIGYLPMKLGALRGEAKSEESELYKSLRDDFKDDRGALERAFFSLDEDRLRMLIEETADAVTSLHALLVRYDERLSAEKKRRGICDFSDIERYTLRLLTGEGDKDSDIARELALGFDVICIDEYQDVNAVQDRIFRAIARPGTRFMVGDIKQSIYSFRGAEPSIFADYRRAFPMLDAEAETDAASIFMSSNFRCDPPVIAVCNRIFSFLFSHCGESIGYVPEDDLVLGKISPAADFAPAEILLCTADDTSATDDEEESIPAEYRATAAEIKRLLVHGRLDDGSPIRPSDIAILMRSKTNADRLIAALAEADIPCDAGSAEDFFENPEVLMMLCLLNTIDNPNRDVYFAGTLRSPLFGFTMDELIRVREASPDADEPLYYAFVRYTEENGWAKGRHFLDRLAEYRAMAEGTPVDRLLNALYRDTAVLAFTGADDARGPARSPEQKRANLRLLYDYARRFEASSYKGLYNFIRYLGDIVAEETKIEAPVVTGADTIRILTIHQSKGLEFPVCFVCGLSRRHNLRDASGNLLFDHEVGVALRLRDETGFARRTTPIREAIAQRMTDRQTEEEMRILYVALTRARERLYLTAEVKDPEKTLAAAARRSRFASADALMGCHCYIDWILTALAYTPEDCYRITFPTAEVREAEPISIPDEIIEKPTADPALTARLRERFDFVYPNEHLTNLPAKLAVSHLYPQLLDEDAAPSALHEETALPDLRRRPAFLDGTLAEAEESAAERGTATHVFLQFCDFSRCAADPTPTGIRAEAERLAGAGFISPRMARLLRTEEIARFFTSPFYTELAAARWQLRERRFHLFMPAAALTEDPEYAKQLGEEKILVQGVIDLCFETADGRLILCDYKTDRLPPDRETARKILAERHGTQLGYYAEACRALFGRLPDTVCLWSLAMGDAVVLE